MSDKDLCNDDISDELKDVCSNLRGVKRKLKRKKKKGVKNEKLKKLERKIRELKKERKNLKKQLNKHEYPAKHQPQWWLGTVEKSVPKLIDLATALLQTRRNIAS